MAKLDVAIEYRDGLTTARLLTSFGAGVIDRHWPGLYEPGPEEPERNPFLRYGVNNNNREEVAVYVGLAWELTAGRRRYAVPVWGRDDVLARGALDDYDPLDWEYAIDGEKEDWAERDRGFVTPRNPLPADPSPWHRANRGKAALFTVESPETLVAMATAMLGDVWCSISLIATAAGVPRDGVAARFRGDRVPVFGEVLAEGDVFVDVTIGTDLGAYDSLLVVAPGDVREEWRAVFAEYRARISAYEDAVGSIADVDDLLTRLGELQRPMPRR